MGAAALIQLLHAATAAFQIGMNLSPTPDLYRVHKFQTTGQMALLPLVLMVFNNHLWMMYGFLTGSVFPLSTAAFIGEVAGIAFTSVYCRWTPDKATARKLCIYTFLGYMATTAYVVLGALGYTHQTLASVACLLGYVGVVINIAMYASPLATVKTVIETKSSASLPINLCIMIFLNCCMWVATSALDHDMFVMIPSAIGLVLSGFQLPLYVIYHQTDPYVEITTSLEEGTGLDFDVVPSSPLTFTNKKDFEEVVEQLPDLSDVNPSSVAEFAMNSYQQLVQLHEDQVTLSASSSSASLEEEEPLKPNSLRASYDSVNMLPRQVSRQGSGLMGTRTPRYTPLKMTSSLQYSDADEEDDDHGINRDMQFTMTPIAAV